MTQILDVYNIILLVLAVFIFFRLRSVLGKRTGNERRPYDPYSKPTSKDEGEQGPSRPAGDNVVAMPGSMADRMQEQRDPEEHDARDEAAMAAKVAPENSPLNTALQQVIAADPTFDPEGFLQGARAAYEMVLGAFAEGDRKALKGLLSREVYDGFVQAIDEREKRGETVHSTFIGIDKAEIIDASLDAKTAQVTVKLQSQLISATKDSEGHIIEGDPNEICEVTDIWTFARDVTSRDPNWKLVATEATE